MSREATPYSLLNVTQLGDSALNLMRLTHYSLLPLYRVTAGK